MIVQIVSPSSAKRDRFLKFNQYEKARVKEYWIVDPIEKIVTIFKLGADHQYGRPDIYAEDAKIQVGIFPELTIDIQSVFENNQESE